jgi:hypothetical protein
LKTLQIDYEAWLVPGNIDIFRMNSVNGAMFFVVFQVGCINSNEFVAGYGCNKLSAPNL